MPGGACAKPFNTAICTVVRYHTDTMLRTVATGFLLLTGVTLAPAWSATIAGSVKDPAGVAIAGASIEIRGGASNGDKIVATDAKGEYRVSDLTAGHYKIRLERAGFEIFEGEVDAPETGEVRVDIQLKLARVVESVMVSGKRPGVDPVYHGLRDSGASQTFTVSNLAFKRDNGAITLRSGLLAFTPKVAGRDTEAVFVGEGEFAFQPLMSTDQSTCRA